MSDKPWEWREGESVPRYVESQISRGTVVNELNRCYELEADKLVLMERDEKYCKTISGLQTANLELEEGNRVAVAEAYRCGYEAGKVENDLWGEAATTIKELEAELAALREAMNVYPNLEDCVILERHDKDAYCWVRREDYDALKEKALAAVKAPYGRALRELEEVVLDRDTSSH